MKTKICTKCKKEFPATPEYFYKRAVSKYNLRSECKKCTKKFKKSPKGQVNRMKEILKRHNLTLNEYDQMFEQQSGMCYICGQTEIGCRLCVDHNHQTNNIRGLLCRSCNILLGYLERMKRDNFIKKAEQYLKNNPQ